jgi:hypothetical protein
VQEGEDWLVRELVAAGGVQEGAAVAGVVWRWPESTGSLEAGEHDGQGEGGGTGRRLPPAVVTPTAAVPPLARSHLGLEAG